MREKNYGMRGTFQFENYSYINGEFKPKKGMRERYGTNPCAEIPLPMVTKETNTKLLLLS